MPADDSSTEPPALGGLLRLVHRAHLGRIYQRLGAAGFTDVSRAQFKLIRWPGMDGLRPGELALRAGLSKQAVNDLLGELERNGYVERHRDPHDARARILRLTDRGQQLEHATLTISRELEAAWATSVGEQRFRDLRATLVEMAERGLPAEEAPGRDAAPEK